MKTIIMEGVVTALSSIAHNGGQNDGISTLLRREKFIQSDGSVEEVPVVSGNSLRGLLRDIGMFHMLSSIGYGVDYATGTITGLSLPAFYFLFSGGALVSTGSFGIDIEFYRKLKTTIPLIGLFGGAVGNMIMPGKLKVGKLIPICTETKHLLPPHFVPEETQSIWDCCQLEMYVRKDDEKDDRLRYLIEGETLKLLEDPKKKREITQAIPQQMRYYVETIAAGTQFYWKVVLEDVTDIELDAFAITLVQFSRTPYIGGKSGIGLGEVAIKMNKWFEIDSRAYLEGTELGQRLGEKYIEYLKQNGKAIRDVLSEIN